MENKKKAKVDYAAIIREFEMYGRGRSLKQFCDDSSYVYSNVFRYYRKCFWNSKCKWDYSFVAQNSWLKWYPLQVDRSTIFYSGPMDMRKDISLRLQRVSKSLKCR